MADTPTTLTLVRHGRVANPNHVVYSDLPGFDLDPVGVLEADAVSRYLALASIDAVISSPLERAIATATAIARPHGIGIRVDERATEWRLSPRWVGQRWDDLPVIVPGQLESYLATPDDLPFAAESLHDVAKRMTELVNDITVASGHVVLVSHQDTIGAAILALTGLPLHALLENPPRHASATAMRRDGKRWVVSNRWSVDEA